MPKAIEGGCLCGAVRYEATAKPVSAIHCYCRQCQHITGAGHASQFALPSASVTLHGKVSKYEMKAESGNSVTSVFCPVCGSPNTKNQMGIRNLSLSMRRPLMIPRCSSRSNRSGLHNASAGI